MLNVLLCWFMCRAVLLYVLPQHLCWYVVFIVCPLTPTLGDDSAGWFGHYR